MVWIVESKRKENWNEEKSKKPTKNEKMNATRNERKLRKREAATMVHAIIIFSTSNSQYEPLFIKQ